MSSDAGRADSATGQEFYDYYAEQSVSPAAMQRFESIQNAIIRLLAGQHGDPSGIEVADIGCNAGTQCILWAGKGYRVHGLDINEKLLDLARERTADAGLDVDYRLGSATDLPWADGSMDVCIAPELLEHVADWRQCLDEFTRILKPNGVLYLSTTNYLCPKQEEFDLPMYSWYPSILKDRYERLAMSSRPQLANYAKYPAVNWFSFYSLREELRIRDFDSLDRFDVIDPAGKSGLAMFLVRCVRAIPPLRFLAHVLTPYTVVLATRRPAEGGD